MALYEYFCSACKRRFEAIRSYRDSSEAPCPKCATVSRQKLISRFAVGGQGDLRESTMHGCHGCHHVGPGHSHGHGHSSPESGPEPAIGEPASSDAGGTESGSSSSAAS